MVLSGWFGYSLFMHLNMKIPFHINGVVHRFLFMVKPFKGSCNMWLKMCTRGHITFSQIFASMESHEQEESNTLTSFAFSLVYQQGYSDQGIVGNGVSAR